MTRTRAPALFRQTVGARPATVTVYEKVPGGRLYARVYDAARQGYVPRSLGHNDKARALAWALELSKSLLAAKAASGTISAPPSLSVSGPLVRGVLLLYSTQRLPQKRRPQQREDQRRVRMFTRLFGDLPVAALGVAEWERFKEDRASGAIDAYGRPVPPGRRARVMARTVDADLVFLISVFNWAVQCPKAGGGMVLDRNPWGGAGKGVKRLLARPRTRTVRRPVATTARYEALLAVAHTVRALLPAPGERADGPPVVQWQASYLPLLLMLAYQTGRRISALVSLTIDRLEWEHGAVAAVRWPPLKDDDEYAVPVQAGVGALLALQVQRVRAYGALVGWDVPPDAPVFPQVRALARYRPGAVVPATTRWTARDWLEAAERTAGLEGLEGGCWHPFRRSWATRKKHLAERDRMAAAGWKDHRTMRMAYEQPDAASMRRVIDDETRLV